MLAPHKATCRDWARRMYAEDALVLDTETTGFASQDIVLEIAVLNLRSQRLVFGCVMDVFSSDFPEDRFLNPDKTIKACHIHALTNADLRNGIAVDVAKTALLQTFSFRTLIAYNSPFDRRLIHQTFSSVFETSKWECAMQASISGFPELLGRTGRIKLDQMCARLAIAPGKHSAYSDALATCQLIEKFANM